MSRVPQALAAPLLVVRLSIGPIRGLEVARGRSRKVHLFITHTHWDHIQGFPFFVPAYSPEFETTIYSARGFAKDLESVFRGQLDQDYFPVQMDDLRGRLRFQYLPDGAVEINGVKISWEYVQHPGATVGYKMEVPGGKCIAWVPDNEFLQGYCGTPHDAVQSESRLSNYRPIIEFLEGVDVLIHEAQYTPEEYVQKVGWGHSSVSNACALAKVTGAKRWIVVHHDPMHTDDVLQDKLNLTRQILRELDCTTEVVHGFDGMVEFL